MNPTVKCIIVGLAAIAASDWIQKTFSGAGDSDTEKMAWKFGGGAAGALAAAKLLKI